jgi:hypothetical protein
MLPAQSLGFGCGGKRRLHLTASQRGTRLILPYGGRSRSAFGPGEHRSSSVSSAATPRPSLASPSSQPPNGAKVDLGLQRGQGVEAFTSRFSVHCPSSIAACFRVSLIGATRAASKFHTSRFGVLTQGTAGDAGVYDQLENHLGKRLPGRIPSRRLCKGSGRARVRARKAPHLFSKRRQRRDSAPLGQSLRWPAAAQSPQAPT